MRLSLDPTWSSLIVTGGEENSLSLEGKNGRFTGAKISLTGILFDVNSVDDHRRSSYLSVFRINKDLHFQTSWR